MSGLEPPTSSLRTTRSSQLSYIPTVQGLGYGNARKKMRRENRGSALRCAPCVLVELRGLEPLTSWLQTRRSSQLSYNPKVIFSYANCILNIGS